MSGSKVVDGKTGQLIGNYTPSGSYGNTATSSYIPAYTTYAYGSTSAPDKAPSYTTQPTYQSGYTTPNYQPAYSSSAGNYNPNGQNYTAGGATSGSRTQAASGQQGMGGLQWTGGQAGGTTVNMGKEVIKGESRIEYVPFEKKIVEYKDQTVVERVPRKIKKVEYRQERKFENIPKEVTVTDYYAIEYLRQYIPQIVPEKVIEYIQVPKKQIRYEYVPVERQIVHYPDQSLEAERGATGSQVAGQVAKEGYMPGYVAGRSETSNVRTGYATSGQGYTTGQSAYPTGQSAYKSGGAAYSTDKVSSTPTLHTTGPSNENLIAGSSNPYTNLQGQRWESTPAYMAEKSQKR